MTPIRKGGKAASSVRSRVGVRSVIGLSAEEGKQPRGFAPVGHQHVGTGGDESLPLPGVPAADSVLAAGYAYADAANLARIFNFDIAVAPQINEFNGRKTIQLKFIDWRPSKA